MMLVLIKFECINNVIFVVVLYNEEWCFGGDGRNFIEGFE